MNDTNSIISMLQQRGSIPDANTARRKFAEIYNKSLDISENKVNPGRGDIPVNNNKPIPIPSNNNQYMVENTQYPVQNQYPVTQPVNIDNNQFNTGQVPFNPLMYDDKPLNENAYNAIRKIARMDEWGYDTSKGQNIQTSSHVNNTSGLSQVRIPVTQNIQETGYTNDVIGQLLSEVNTIKKKLNMNESSNANDMSSISLFIDGEQYNGKIVQNKGDKKILFLLDDNTYCFILTPSSKKSVVRKKS